MKIKNFMKYFKGVLKYFKISMKLLNISKWNISSCIPICDNCLCLYRDTVFSSSVSSDESEIDANSNDDAVDGEHIELYPYNI